MLDVPHGGNPGGRSSAVRSLKSLRISSTSFQNFIIKLFSVHQSLYNDREKYLCFLERIFKDLLVRSKDQKVLTFIFRGVVEASYGCHSNFAIFPLEQHDVIPSLMGDIVFVLPRSP